MAHPLYLDDLAYVHHVGFGDFAVASAPGLLDLMRKAGVTSGLVVDLACGSGLWLRELLAAGYAGLGVDGSPAMIELARTVAPDADFEVGSLWEYEPPACDAVTILGEGLSYLPPGGGRPPALKAFFRRLAQSLRRGGLLVFDVMVEGLPMAYRTFEQGGDWAVLAQVSEEPARRRLTREITTFRRIGEGFRRSRETHRLRVFSRDEVDKALRAAGFAVSILRRYGEQELAARRLAFRARRV